MKKGLTSIEVRKMTLVGFLFLTSLFAACGSSSTAIGPSQVRKTSTVPSIPTPSPTPSPPPLIIFPLAVTLGSPDGGYQAVTVTLGIRNNSTNPLPLLIPADTPANVSIKEGRNYNFDLAITTVPCQNCISYSYNTGAVFGGGTSTMGDFQLPPSYALCGITDPSWGPMVLQATGKIPAQTTLDTLTIENYPSIDLTKTPSTQTCTPHVSPSLPQLPLAIDVSTQSTSATGHLQIANTRTTASGDATIIHVQLQNTDKLDELSLDDLLLWTISDTGITQVPFSNYLGGADGFQCNSNPQSANAGPSQTVTFDVCIRKQPNIGNLAMLVIASQKNNIYKVVRLA